MFLLVRLKKVSSLVVEHHIYESNLPNFQRVCMAYTLSLQNRWTGGYNFI